MNLSMHISNKTHKNKNKEKRRVRNFFKFLKSLKYEFLILCEIVSLLCAFLFSSSNKKKHFILFASLSTLFGAYLTLSGVNYIKDSVEGRKLVDILSSGKTDD